MRHLFIDIWDLNSYLRVNDRRCSMLHALEATRPSSYDLVRFGSKHLVDDEWPLPRWCELVPVLAALNPLEDKVPNVELAGAHVVLMVVS
jgi:hypothetical protein